ncbi:MAG: YitT family protein [Marinifilaceae bacterium]|nr:YitT family protein [Marinifilaceae bacterium]
MNLYKYKIQNIRKQFSDYFELIAGCLVVAVGFCFFILPKGLVPGTIFGVGIMINKFTSRIFPNGIFDLSQLPSDLGTVDYILNGLKELINDLFRLNQGGIPVGFSSLIIIAVILIIARKCLGPRFGYRTVLAFLLCSIFIDSLSLWWGHVSLVEDELLSCIFGGIAIGFGYSLIIKSRATVAGTDILAMMIAKKAKLPLSQTVIYIDSLIVISSLSIGWDWQIPLYSWVTIYIIGKVSDYTLQGSNYQKAMIIISSKPDIIRDKIIGSLNRGGTFLKAEGMFDRKEKKAIYIVVNRREMQMIHDFVQDIDPDAFITISQTSEIQGAGFKAIESIENLEKF